MSTRSGNSKVSREELITERTTRRRGWSLLERVKSDGE